MKPINTSDEAFAELLAWYDSYQFSPKRLVKVINPVSLGNALSSRELKGYWEATAGSTLVYDALKAAAKRVLRCRPRQLTQNRRSAIILTI